MLSITDLPDLVLTYIFSFLTLDELLTSVNRVCTTFNFLIKESSKLWKEFDFYGALHIKETDLIYILKHSSCFRSFIIGYSEYCGSSDSLDFHLTTTLSLSRNLVWLDIRRCKLSTICFVQYLPKLELLNVTDCRNLYDVDFQVISKCMQLEQLYLSFNEISARTVIDMARNLKGLIFLDVFGLKLTLLEAREILNFCHRTLTGFYLSLATDITQDNFYSQVGIYFRDIHFSFYTDTTWL